LPALPGRGEKGGKERKQEKSEEKYGRIADRSCHQTVSSSCAAGGKKKKEKKVEDGS